MPSRTKADVAPKRAGPKKADRAEARDGVHLKGFRSQPGLDQIPVHGGGLGGWLGTLATR